MNNVFAVQIVDSQAKLNEHLPNEIFNQGLAILLADKRIQIPMLAILLDDVDGGAVNERVIIAHYVMRVKLTHYLDLLQCFECCFFWQQSGVDFFDDVVLVNLQTPQLVLLGER